MIDITNNIAIKNCTKNTPCVKKEYQLETVKAYDYTQKCLLTEYSNLDTCLILSFGHKTVESIVTTASYDTQSLIGEVGGTLGLFLGLSGLSILEIMILVSSNGLWKKYCQRVIVFSFLTIFVYWGIVAFLKFWEQPKAMQISIKKENLMKEFPAITFCIEPDDGLYFYQFIEEQLRKNETWGHFNDDNCILANIIDPYIKCKSHTTYLKSEDIWSPFYHRNYGLCYTLDIRKEKDLKIENGPISLGFESQWIYGYLEDRRIFLHDFEDLLNDDQTWIPTIGFRSKHFAIRKTKYSSVSTKSQPCNENSNTFQVCKDIEMHDYFMKQYQCQIPFLLSWSHSSYTSSLPICNNSVTLMSFQNPTEFVTACKSVLPCKYSRYTIQSKEDKANEVYNDMNTPKIIEITLDDTLELHESLIAYDGVSFIGETGGTLGMCLGWSLFFFIESLLDYAVKNSNMHKKLTRLSTLSLLMIFLYWFSFTIIDYHEQSESMELGLETMTYPPYITICRKSANPYTFTLEYGFMVWLNELYPCSKNQTDYKDGVIACLQFNHTDILETVQQYSSIDSPFLPTVVLSSEIEEPTLNKEVWKNVFHEKYGACWTLDSIYWHRYYSSTDSKSTLLFS